MFIDRRGELLLTAAQRVFANQRAIAGADDLHDGSIGGDDFGSTLRPIRIAVSLDLIGVRRVGVVDHVLRAGPIAFRLGKRDGVAEALDRMPIDIRAGHGIVGLGGSGEAEHEQQGGDQYDQVAEAVKRTIV